MKQNTVLGILAHVDAGKTTLSERLLYMAGAVRALGRVDQKTSLLDHAEIERQRGITVFSDQAELSLSGRPFTLIDTPGHVDFSGEMERCLLVLDCAVLVVSSVEGVQAHTETLWELLRSHHIPTLVFLNKADRDMADIPGTLAQLEELGGADFFDCTEEDWSNPSEQLQEFAAGQEEALLNGYLEGKKIPWGRELSRLMGEERLFPVFRGSALTGEGVEALIQGLCLLAPSREGKENLPFAGQIYQVRHNKGGRMVRLKVEQGILRAKDCIGMPDGRIEKCNELRSAVGEKYLPLAEARPGMVCAVTGISGVPGDWVGENARHGEAFSLVPLLSARVLFDEKTIPSELLSQLRELEDEEPLLNVEWEEATQELSVHVMGEIQLEVLGELFRERFKKEISFGPCSVLYGETIEEPVVGCGHFEPLRHYAEVHLLLSPGEPGSGITFGSLCSRDSLSGNWQNLIETHVLEKQHRGVLIGAPLMDVKITLLSGRDHLKHTEGGDFREATYRAIRHGLMQAKSRLLEPYYHFELGVEYEELGRVQGDLLRRQADCQAPVERKGRMYLSGRAPVRLMMDYPPLFAAWTKGRGRISLTFDGYSPCEDQVEILAQSTYEPERDLENTPDSVFCSHGAGFPVKWREAAGYMHLPVENPEKY